MKRTNHYQVVISDTSADDGKITPTWTKVSATPWKGKATHHGGYGRRCINASVSDDMPRHFVRTEFLARPEPLKSPPRMKAGSRCSPEAALVLPGGASERDRPKHGRRYNKLIHNKQLIIEPVITERSGRSDIKWDKPSGRSDNGFSQRSDHTGVYPPSYRSGDHTGRLSRRSDI
mmetsp:Transcript_3439/g.5369  ORF Transcript_3439/g.5369 Transcript_3439/m.5369 type:complete len:175 (+) Transcript_3439:147-671(+)|eukprot:CAMPEP_0185026490 /NCGR_PEP_ID=MMETSP1103-20130426/10779_1 /TAXON_ID=36769 /ORGANISM="Paraphysomonas bandaiensis, Strain Caron Lab Isolate" /LENGTH=174 /DNA_ID=CAMNT_0027560093 /DNA_START=65 /DNA_END=589 /DNA_ORIENTATION=+